MLLEEELFILIEVINVFENLLIKNWILCLKWNYLYCSKENNCFLFKIKRMVVFFSKKYFLLNVFW